MMFDAYTRAQRIRMDCLDRAMRALPCDSIADIVAASKLLEAYVAGADIAAAERTLAAIGAAMKDSADA